MDKPTWLQLTREDRTSRLNVLLASLVEMDKVETEYCRTKQSRPLNINKFPTEQQVLQILAWEKEEHEED